MTGEQRPIVDKMRWLKSKGLWVGGVVVAAVVWFDNVAAGLTRVYTELGRLPDFAEQHLAAVAIVLGAMVAASLVALAIVGKRLHLAAEQLRIVAAQPTVDALDGGAFLGRRNEIVQSRIEEIRNVVKNAKHEIRVTGIANELITSKLGRSDELLRFFERGGHMKVMFMDPLGIAVRKREQREEHDPNRFDKLALKSAANIVLLRLYRQKIDEFNTRRRNQGLQPAQLEIKVYDEDPKLNMFIVDDTWVAVHHYGAKARGNVSPRITIVGPESANDPGRSEAAGETVNRAALAYFRNDFDAMWGMANDLPDSSWLACGDTFSWSDVANVDVDDVARVDALPDKIAQLNICLSRDRPQHLQQRSELARTKLALDTTRADVVELETRLADAERRALSRGDLNGVRLRIFSDKAPRRHLVAEQLRTARESIDVVGVVNEWITTDLPDEDFLRPFFNDLAGTMRALFINPFGQAVDDREMVESRHQNRDIPSGDFATRTSGSIDRLRRYSDAALEVRVYERPPTLGLLIIDKRWALVSHYGLSAQGVKTPAIEVDGRNDVPLARSLLDYYLREFELLWNMETSSVWTWGARDGRDAGVAVEPG